MNNRSWIFWPLGLVLLYVSFLSGCASAPTIQPQAIEPYTVSHAGPDIYRILYRGEAAASDERIVDFALARASHVADSEGYRYFSVIDESKSGAGEIHYYEDDASLARKADPKTLLVQCFSHRPKRIVCFRAGDTANVVYEKYGLNRRPGAF